jgi:hypothetical protein
MTMSQAHSLILALLLAFMLPETIAAADPPAVSPESVTWTVAGAFSFEKKPAKTRESLRETLKNSAPPILDHGKSVA